MDWLLCDTCQALREAWIIDAVTGSISCDTCEMPATLSDGITQTQTATQKSYPQPT
jgi:hypothetical protein